MKRLWRGSIAIALVGGLALAAAGPAWADEADPPEAWPVGTTIAFEAPEAPAAQVVARTITVGGTGEATARPDQATISFGTEAQSASAAEAMSLNAERINAVTAAVLASGIPAQNVQTTGINLSPVRNQSGTQTIGYRASATINARVPGVEETGQLIDAATQAGASQVYGIQFSLRDPGVTRAEALRNAVADARRRADAIAESLGVQITGVEGVIESGATAPPAPRVTANVAAAPASGIGVAPDVQPGELTVRASVSVTFTF